ncbi:MAG: cohesin domain-containing protein, partial [Acidobacteriota bacterium]
VEPGAAPAGTPPAPGATTAAPAPPARAAGAAQIALSVPTEMRLGSGPYTIPISVVGATGLATITVSLGFDPAVVRVRAVTEGPFMRQGGVAATFTDRVDAATGRVEIVVTRAGDQIGASGSGLLAAVLVEPVAAGRATVAAGGVGSLASGGAAVLQFSPATVTVK